MTPFENSLYVALVAPAVALVIALFFKNPLAFRWSSLLLGLAGVAGVAASAYGAVQDAPFTLVTPVFYSMTIALDRFGSIFFLGISIVIASAGMFAVSYGKKHESDQVLLRSLSIATATLVIGTQWVVLAGNIVGFIAAWEIMMLAIVAFTFAQAQSSDRRLSLRAFFVAHLSTTAITAGFFTLTAGALFSDFGTLAYLAGQSEPIPLAVGYGLILFGFALSIGLVPFHRWFLDVASNIPSHVSAMLRATVSGVAFYAFIRCILFILPPLSLWFVLPVLVLGVFSMVAGAMFVIRENNLKRFIAQLSVQNFGLVALMIGGAMAFQALALYDAMNVLLFAAFIQLTVNAVATSGLFLVRNLLSADNETLEHLGGRAKHMPKLTLATGILLAGAVGAPPFATMTSAWMLATTLGTIASSIARPFGIVAIVLLVLFVLSRLLTVVAAFRWFVGVFLGVSRSSHSEPIQEPTDAALIPIVFSALVVLVSGFAVPQLLLAIGANPLTDAAGTFQGGVVTAAGTLRMGVVGGAVAGILLVLWYFRASWVDRIPSFEAIESFRHRVTRKIVVGDRYRALWNRALAKLRR